ncbi:connector enhancer of kinase suppressor of ras 1 isoform X3 [Ranitomeya imitator]|uniref:connector enhancer of kinase suppressor of ras 1 isoform X3 n=1 Tax=Ranitomeya imitator TaxID=111125 RepID=UPI0037E871C4
MELISSWSPDTVSGYLEGLDPSVQHYCFQGWSISGQNLLVLSPQHLDALGVRSIGHQEIFLEAVEQLCALHYELHSETLRSLTDKLYRVSQSLCSHILSLRKASPVSQSLVRSPTQKQLACIIDIVSAARGLFSWLNRYLFTRLNDYSASRDVIALCVELAELLHKDWSDLPVENRVLAICGNICGICRSILHCSPESLLGQTATLELVQIYPESSSSLGIEFKSTSSGQHFVCRIAPEDVSRPRSGSYSSSKSAVSLLSVPFSTGVLRSSVSESNLSNTANVAVSNKDEIQGQEDSIKNLQTTLISPKSQEADKKQQKSPSIDKRVPGGLPQSQKGTITKLSRRRVSCKDLGSPDCDGWLWQRKENVGFMSQKWKRCWCVLKKDRLYWYSSPQEEKALGLLNISVYSLEKPPEAKSKKKYEFQLSHPTYKQFVFAADKLTDMEMWLTSLLKTLQKYKAPQSSSHSREEDCYSETEAEDDEHQVRSHDIVKKPLIQSPSKNIPPPKLISAREDGGDEGGQSPKSSNTQPLKQSPVKNIPEPMPVIPCEGGAEGGGQAAKSTEDDLHVMMTCLKQGGVSLIGKKTAMTRDEYRKSFIRRNKNPDINHKAHALRVLQSTLKAKLLELQSLNQVLENSDLNSAAFQKWKFEHEHLYGRIGQSPQAQRAVTGNKSDKSNPDGRESEESD